MSRDRGLLFIGALMPILYFTVLIMAGFYYPDYSHIRQVASDLGAAGAVGLIGGFGRLGASRLWALATSVTIITPALSLGMSGLFPLPSPYHSNFYMLVLGILTPLFGALTLRGVARTGPLRAMLLFAFGAALVLVAILFGLGGLVSEDNLGLWLRIWAAISLPPVGLLCWAVRQRIA